MSRLLSRLRRGIWPRVAYAMLALGGITSGSAWAQEEGKIVTQSATVTLPPGGRGCLGPIKGSVFLRATGDATGRLDYFMRRSDSGATGAFNRIPNSDIMDARQYDFTIDIEGRPDLLPGFFKVCATNNKAESVRVDLTLKAQLAPGE